MGSGSINSAIFVVTKNAVIFKNIEYSAHLREDEDSAPLFLHPGKYFVKHDHLAGIVDKVLVGGVRWTGLSSFEQVRVVAAFSELHDNIQESRF